MTTAVSDSALSARRRWWPNHEKRSSSKSAWGAPMNMVRRSCRPMLKLLDM
jgi:hypothetical protein